MAKDEKKDEAVKAQPVKEDLSTKAGFLKMRERQIAERAKNAKGK